MKIRLAQVRDLEEIDEIYREGQLDEEKGKKPKKEILNDLTRSENDRLKGFSKAISSSRERFLVCEEDGKLIGFGGAALSSKKRGAEVSLVYLRGKYRNKGFGSKILHQLMKWLKAKGEEDVFVTMDVSNEASINLHKKAGFRESIIFMKKKL